jgi:hypothetical protein
MEPQKSADIAEAISYGAGYEATDNPLVRKQLARLGLELIRDGQYAHATNIFSGLVNNKSRFESEGIYSFYNSISVVLCDTQSYSKRGRMKKGIIDRLYRIVDDSCPDEFNGPLNDLIDILRS